MKKIVTDNQALLECLKENGINTTCNPEMDILISDDDAEKIASIVLEFAPAALFDYTITDQPKYWHNLRYEDKVLYIRQLDDTYQFNSNYQDSELAAYNVRVGYENDPDWYQIEITDLDKFENELKVIIDREYFNE